MEDDSESPAKVKRASRKSQDGVASAPVAPNMDIERKNHLFELMKGNSEHIEAHVREQAATSEKRGSKLSLTSGDRKNRKMSTLSIQWASDEKEDTSIEVLFSAKSEYMNKATFLEKTNEVGVQIDVTHQVVRIVLLDKTELETDQYQDPPEDKFPLFVMFEDKEIDAKDIIGRMRVLALRLVDYWAWDFFFGIVIAGNAATIGIEISQKINCVIPAEADAARWADFEDIKRAEIVNDALGKCTEVIWWLDFVFNFLYTLEIVCVFMARGWIAWANNWVKADLFFVFIGYFNYFMDIVLTTAPAGLKQLKLLRALRLLRLARPLRLLKFCEDLWKLVSGLMASAYTIAYTIALILIMIYISSCLAVELIKKPTDDAMERDPTSRDPEFVATQQLYFSSLTETMLSLMSVIAMDSFAGIYTPLVWFAPDELTRFLYVMFFSIVVLTIAVVLMNLITAVVVENAMAQSEEGRDEQQLRDNEHKKQLVDQLKKTFENIDDDGSGYISFKEADMEDEANVMWKDFVVEHMNLYSALEVFDALDLDERFEVKIGEFIDKIKYHVTHPGPQPIRRCERIAERMKKKAIEMDSHLDVIFQHHFEHPQQVMMKGYKPLRANTPEEKTARASRRASAASVVSVRRASAASAAELQKQLQASTEADAVGKYASTVGALTDEIEVGAPALSKE